MINVSLSGLNATLLDERDGASRFDSDIPQFSRLASSSIGFGEGKPGGRESDCMREGRDILGTARLDIQSGDSCVDLERAIGVGENKTGEETCARPLGFWKRRKGVPENHQLESGSPFPPQLHKLQSRLPLFLSCK